MLEKANQEIIIIDQEKFAQPEPNLLVSNIFLSRVDSKVQEIQTKELIGIKHFDFIQLLGKGAFGHVYKVRCKLNGKVYALKQQDKDKLMKQGQIKYAKGELKVLK